MSEIKDLKELKELYGWVRKDGFGRVYFDLCKDDYEHLTKPAEEGEERRHCRYYVEDLFEKVIDKNVGARVMIFFMVQEP